MGERRVEIRTARTAQDMARAGELFTEYVASLPGVCGSFMHQRVDEEIAGLPGKYAEPLGCILLAEVVGANGGEAVGCVALRPIAARAGDAAPVCEMKRMYTRPTARGLGIGRSLAERVMEEARARGYRMMKLDTEPQLEAAVRLYHSLGFVEVERFNEDPEPCTMYFGKVL